MKGKTRMDKLDTAMIGDQLIISNGAIEVVTRKTKTLLITERKNGIGKIYECKYRRSDGYMPGMDTWSSIYARLPCNENEIPEIMEARRVTAMINRLNDHDFKRLPVNVIETIVGIINANN